MFTVGSEILAEPLNDTPLIVLAVCKVVAVQAFQFILHTIVEEKVFTPHTVCAVVRSTTSLASASPVTAPVLPFTEVTGADVINQESFVSSLVSVGIVGVFERSL